MRAEAIAFDGAPGHLQARRTLAAQSDAVLPMIVATEVPAGPAQQADLQILGGVENVLAIPIRVRQARALLENAAIDAAAQRLDEITVDLRSDVADHAIGVDGDWAQVNACCARAINGAARKAFENDLRDDFIAYLVLTRALARGQPFSQVRVEMCRTARPSTPS
jgi:hypothetical protein